MSFSIVFSSRLYIVYSPEERLKKIMPITFSRVRVTMMYILLACHCTYVKTVVSGLADVIYSECKNEDKI